MYEYDINRWWQGPEGQLIAETVTWQQHFQTVETTDPEGDPVSRNEPLDPRARSLGPLCPRGIPAEDDIWLFASGLGLDWMDFAAMDIVPNETVPPFDSPYWSVYSVPVRRGWMPIPQQEYLAAKELADAAMAVSDEESVEAVVAALQAEWDGKSAALAADGLGQASIAALIGPRPTMPS